MVPCSPPLPSLRALAISLSGNVDRADDLVQETLLRAMANINSFEPGTNMSAWLFTILRNLFRSEYRKRRREVEDADGRHVDSLKSASQQNTGTGSAFASCPRGGRKTPPLLTILSPASKRGFFLIKNPERNLWGTRFNRIAGSVLLAALFWSEQSYSDNFGKLAYPNQNGLN